ncbi:hypothetical protein [Taklimakanibacter deserti]|uniref:hypothetical protein n=1 Tax=Taklimakanibacter deserti TaxID=2267839 RepID=UPI0013C4B67B
MLSFQTKCLVRHGLLALSAFVALAVSGSQSFAEGICDAAFVDALATKTTETDRTDIQLLTKERFCSQWRKSGSSSLGVSIYGIFGISGSSSSKNIGSLCNAKEFQFSNKSIQEVAARELPEDVQSSLSGCFAGTHAFIKDFTADRVNVKVRNFEFTNTPGSITLVSAKVFGGDDCSPAKGVEVGPKGIDFTCSRNESARKGGSTIQFEFRKSANGPLETTTLAVPPDLVIEKNFELPTFRFGKGRAAGRCIEEGMEPPKNGTVANDETDIVLTGRFPVAPLLANFCYARDGFAFLIKASGEKINIRNTWSSPATRKDLGRGQFEIECVRDNDKLPNAICGAGSHCANEDVRIATCFSKFKGKVPEDIFKLLSESQNASLSQYQQ